MLSFPRHSACISCFPSAALKQTVFRQTLAQRIECDQQHEVDDGIEQINSRSQAVIHVQQSTLVHIGRNDFRRFIRTGVIQQDDLFISYVHHSANAQQEHDRHRSGNAGKRNMQQLLSAGCTVNGSRFIEHGIDAGKRAQVDDRSESYLLPDSAGYIDRPKQFRPEQQVARFSASQGRHQLRQNATGIAKIHQHTT